MWQEFPGIYAARISGTDTIPRRVGVQEGRHAQTACIPPAPAVHLARQVSGGSHTEGTARARACAPGGWFCQLQLGQASSTPATDGERVYGLTSDGDLCCLQAKDGAILWKKNLASDYSVQGIGFASAVVSPVLEGDLVLFNGSFAQIAVDKLTGDLKWKHDDQVKAGKSRPGSSATPVVCDVGGKRCVLFLGGETASLLEVATGNRAVVVRPRLTTGIIADPIVSNGKAYIFQRDVCYCFDLTKDSSKPVWQSDAFPVPYVAPVLVDGYLSVRAGQSQWRYANTQRVSRTSSSHSGQASSLSNPSGAWTLPRGRWSGSRKSIGYPLQLQAESSS